MAIEFSPSDRIAIVGKTGSGKTWHSVALASLLVPIDSKSWECWWLDSKLDPRDGQMLKDWSFGAKKSARKHIKLDPKNGEPAAQAQALCEAAMKRRNVLLVADEYAHIVLNTRSAGPGIKGVHLRGRGLNVGILGQTQQPVTIPRELLSQATHIFLFDLTYPRDLKMARELYDGYQRPPDRHGFYHAHIDGDAKWRYYPHSKAWHDSITGATKVSA